MNFYYFLFSNYNIVHGKERYDVIGIPVRVSITSDIKTRKKHVKQNKQYTHYAC